MSKKSDLAYILVNILCLAFLILDIELENYFGLLAADYQAYVYPQVMTRLAGPFVLCLLITYRQSAHQSAAVSSRIFVDICSVMIFLVYIHFFYIIRFSTGITAELFVILCLFLGPALYEIGMTITKKIRIRIRSWALLH